MRLALLAVALVAGAVNGAVAQPRPAQVDVTVAVSATDIAHVEQRYTILDGSPSLEFRLLLRPCATVEQIHVERSGVPVTLLREQRGPWLIVRDTMAPAGDSLEIIVRYDVRLSVQSVDVPLLHLTAPVARDETAREGAVSVAVRLPDDGSAVRFPHMTRQAPGEWRARYVAIPSFVTLSRAGAARDCEAATADEGDNGGLVWRFALLVGIMLAWVPLYLTWARRSGDGE